MNKLMEVFYGFSINRGENNMSAIVLTSTAGMSNDEWLNWRKRGIGGSDASIVCGVNKYKSPVELFMEKTGQLSSADAGEAAYWGKQLESTVKAEFAKRTGIKVVDVNKLLCCREYPYMLANLDGICRSPDYGTCVFEAKTASAFKAVEWEDAIPQEYMLQLQHYLSVTGYRGAYIAVLIGGNTFKWSFIERDEELITKLIRWEHDFWSHVQADIPPPLDGSEASAQYLNKRYPRGLPQSSVKLPEAAVELIRQYDEACEKGDAFNEQKQRAENLLKEMLSDNEIGVAGDRIVTWKSFTQERLDGKALKAEHPEIHKQYANQTFYRRFNVKAASWKVRE
jgi:putative phage-type endonuclease